VSSENCDQTCLLLERIFAAYSSLLDTLGPVLNHTIDHLNLQGEAKSALQGLLCSREFCQCSEGDD
jgi:hypothetical protein